MDTLHVFHLAGAALDHDVSSFAHSPCLLREGVRGSGICGLELLDNLIIRHIGQGSCEAAGRELVSTTGA